MVKVIMGLKGTGKTKQMIELINTAVENEHGNVVAIAHGSKLTYDISYKIRLVDTSEYNMPTFDCLKGFIYGLYASNYDISHVFIDNLCKIIGGEINAETEAFINWLDAFGEQNHIKFTATISADPSMATDGMAKFL